MATVNSRLSQVLSDNGDTDFVDCRGPVVFMATGTFNSGTITPYLVDSAGNEAPLSDGALTAAGTYLINLPERSRNRVFARLAGASSPTVNVFFNSE